MRTNTAIRMPLVALGYLYHWKLWITSCLSFFYIRLGGTGTDILGSAAMLQPRCMMIVGAVARTHVDSQSMDALLATVHGCSHHYARTCCTPYRITTRHATAEGVQRAGWTVDGSVPTIYGTSCPAPGTWSTQKRATSGQMVWNFVVIKRKEPGWGHGTAQTLGIHSAACEASSLENAPNSIAQTAKFYIGDVLKILRLPAQILSADIWISKLPTQIRRLQTQILRPPTQILRLVLF